MHHPQNKCVESTHTASPSHKRVPRRIIRVRVWKMVRMDEIRPSALEVVEVRSPYLFARKALALLAKNAKRSK